MFGKSQLHPIGAVAIVSFFASNSVLHGQPQTCAEMEEVVEAEQNEYTSLVQDFSNAQETSSCLDLVASIVAEAAESFLMIDEASREEVPPQVEYPECAVAYGALTADEVVAHLAAAEDREAEIIEKVRNSFLRLEDAKRGYNVGCP